MPGVSQISPPIRIVLGAAIAFLAVYMVFLTILLSVPFILWLGYAVSTTRRAPHDR